MLFMAIMFQYTSYFNENDSFLAKKKVAKKWQYPAL